MFLEVKEFLFYLFPKTPPPPKSFRVFGACIIICIENEFESTFFSCGFKPGHMVKQYIKLSIVYIFKCHDIGLNVLEKS